MKFACLVTVLHSDNSFYHCYTVIAAVLWMRVWPCSVLFDFGSHSVKCCTLPFVSGKNLDSQTYKMLSRRG